MAYMEVRGLCKIYRQGERQTAALKDATFTVSRGDMVALVGRSGSGKSTLMNLLGCLDTPTAGEYRLDGQDVAALSNAQLARVRNREIGFIFQQFHLIGSLTALENVQLPLVYRGWRRARARARAEECLIRMGLGDRLGYRPQELSGGQQQRVAIARAVAGDPPLLLADEPTGNLDHAAATEVMTLLGDLNREGRTVLIITHDPAIAAAAPRRVTVCDGVAREE